MEGDVLDSIPVIHEVLAHLDTLLRARLVGGLEDEDRVLLLDDMSRHLARARLEALIVKRSKREPTLATLYTW